MSVFYPDGSYYEGQYADTLGGMLRHGFGVDFRAEKVRVGRSLTNRYFRTDYAAARKHGYRVGAYHFFSTRTTARQQADHFIKNSRYQKGDFPPALDVEPSAVQIAQMGGSKVLLKAVRSWLEDVERRLGVRPILYVSQLFVNKHLTADNPDGDYLRQNYQVWIARYGEYKPDVHLAIWQLSPDGKVRGIRGLVDINVFNGFDEAFREFSSISAHSLPQPSPR